MGTIKKIILIITIIIIGTILITQSYPITTTLKGETNNYNYKRFHLNESQDLIIHAKITDNISIIILDEWNFTLFKSNKLEEIKDYYYFEPGETDRNNYLLERFKPEGKQNYYIIAISKDKEIGIYDILIERNFGF